MSALSWVFYVVAVSLLVGAGAVALEATLRAAGRGGRAAWGLAFALLLAVPVVSWLRPPPPAGSTALDVLAVPLGLLPAVTATAASASFDPLRLLPYAWAGATVLLALLLLLSWRALRRAARHWRTEELEGVPLWVSARTGPAVVGVRRPRIVLPEWVLELSGGDRRLTLLHELEHLRAGDARLLLAGLAVAVVFPWNPVVWWALHRLRGAVELDCDGRVLKQAGDPAAYGRLLLEVGRRRTERYLLAAAFAEPRVLLERRVRALLQWPGARRPVIALAAGAAALLCFGFAYVTPQPLARGAQHAAVPGATSFLLPSDTPPPLAAKPTFTPFTQAPQLLNRDEITKALIVEYPPALKAAGKGGKVLVWVFIDEAGSVANALVKTGSDQPELDLAGLRVAKQMRFQPAQNRDTVVPVWVEIPIVFTTDGAKAGQAPNVMPAGKAPNFAPGGKATNVTPGGKATNLAPAGGAPPPPPTPFKTAPELQNQAEVKEVLVKSYPPLLKSAGIGGKSLVAAHIEADGTVSDARLKGTSGQDALDQAALGVARHMRFRPALDEAGKPIAVWVELPIVFGTGKQPQPGPDVAPTVAEVKKVQEGTQSKAGAGTGEKVQMAAPQRQLLNADEVVRVLIKAYPPALRDAGITGAALLRLNLNEQGEVTNAEIAKSSGRKELDEAALRVAKVYRFAPGPAGYLDVPVKFTLQ